MAFQSVPNTAQARVIFDLEGTQFSNTFFYEADAGYGQSDLDDLAVAVDSLAVPTLLNLLEDSVSYLRTDVTGLENINDLASSANAATGLGGQGGNRPMPLNVAFCITRRSGLTGRSARGRTYIGGLPATGTAFMSPGYTLLSTAYAAGLLAAVDLFRSMTSSLVAWQPVLVSRYTLGSKRPVGVTFNWTETTFDDRKVDTRRSRV